jgi:two-component system cell cycle response regulator
VRPDGELLLLLLSASVNAASLVDRLLPASLVYWSGESTSSDPPDRCLAVRSVSAPHYGPSSRQARGAALSSLVVLALWLVGYQINTLWGPGEAKSALFGHLAFVLVLALAALLCVARGWTYRQERGAWIVLGAGCLLWDGGEAFYGLVLAPMKQIPIPSLADASYLAFYPLAFVGVIMLLRARSGRTGAGQWLDGLTAALAAGALSAAVGLDATLRSIGGKPLEVATDIAYPIGDLLLLAVIVGAVVVCGLRAGRAWLWLASGITLFCVADSLYLVQSAQGVYALGSWFDVGWPAGMVLLAAAAWSDAPGHASLPLPGARGVRPIILPMCFALISIVLLLYAGSAHVNWAARILAAASLGLVLVRLTKTFRDNTEVMAQRYREARTDALTGLPNRRALSSDLGRLVHDISPENPATVAIFDLDGFKHYNDSFGHHAGDALLTRLGSELSESITGVGRAYRMGGDEFCAVIRGGKGIYEDALPRAAAALTEAGTGFEIKSSWGSVYMPREASDPESAMRLADHRMYASKGAGRGSAKSQSHEVLMQALREHTPAMGDHTAGVRELAEAVARELGRDDTEVEMTGITADLHDIGKIAMPQAVLEKAGPLSDEEWKLMHRHTIVGERILAAAPALAEVALAVRSTHERWDGQGYPDGLAGGKIPQAARVVSACDAFDAMIADRPYSAPRATDDAVLEIQHCAGTQFDPAVVNAFLRVIRSRYADPTSLPAEPRCSSTTLNLFPARI